MLKRPSIPDHLDLGAGRPIVLLPGMEGAKEFWRHQWPALSARYRVLPVSYRRRPLGRWTIADFAADILALLDHHGLERAAVVGESFGGMLAQELATRHGERVAALILCNTFDRARNDHFGVNLFTVASLLHPLAFALPGRFRLPYLDWIGKHRGFVMDPSPGNRDLAEYILEHGLDPGWCYLNRYSAGIRGDYRDLLPSITAPTLVVHGEEDRLVGERTIAELAGRIPGARVARIEGGGHCCQYTRPEATNRVLVDWLAENYPPGNGGE